MFRKPCDEKKRKQLATLAEQFATLETRKKLGRVYIRKDFWDCYKGRGKIGQQLTDTSPVTIPGTIAGHSPPVLFLFLEWQMPIKLGTLGAEAKE